MSVAKLVKAASNLATSDGGSGGLELLGMVVGSPMEV